MDQQPLYSALYDFELYNVSIYSTVLRLFVPHSRLATVPIRNQSITHFFAHPISPTYSPFVNNSKSIVHTSKFIHLYIL